MSQIANMNKFPENVKKAAVYDYENSGQSMSAIAKKYGASTATIQRWVVTYGNNSRRKGAPDKYEKNVVKQAVDDYLAGKGSLRLLTDKYKIGNASLLLYHVKKEIANKEKEKKYE